MARKETDPFEGAEIIGAVPFSAQTAKVVQRLKDGRVALGTFYVTESGQKPRGGGVMFPSLESFIVLADQAKAGQVVDLSALEMPEPEAPKAKAATQVARLDKIEETLGQVTTVLAQIAQSMSAKSPNGKAAVKS